MRRSEKAKCIWDARITQPAMAGQFAFTNVDPKILDPQITALGGVVSIRERDGKAIVTIPREKADEFVRAIAAAQEDGRLAADVITPTDVHRV